MAQISPSEVAGATGGAPLAVLVIDGNEEHQILSVAALTRRRWSVRTAASGKQGLQIAIAGHFDAIVLGSKLRDASGLEVLRLLAERLPQIPKIFVVPPEGEEAALQAMKSGAHSYIVKTPRYTELLPGVVQEQVDEARNRARLADSEKIQAQALTERKTVEDRLSQSEARLKMLLEQAPVILWSTDRELRVTSAMGAGLRTLHPVPNEEAIPLSDYFNVPGEDIEPIPAHRRALAGESLMTQLEWQGRTFEVHVEPLRSAEGDVIGTIGVAFDVSERTRTEESLRRSEERFQLLGRATSDVVWDWDLQTDGLWLNDNMARAFGYRAEDVEPTGAWWRERIHPADRERVSTSFKDLFDGSGTVWSAEYRFLRREGGYATVVDRGYVLHDSAGHPIRMIGSLMDVTRQRKAEAIQSAVYKISEAANTAHDLPDLYRQIHAVVGGLMPATNFYIALHDPAADTLEFPYFVDEAEGPPPPQKLGRGLTEYVLRTARPLLASPAVFEELVRQGEVVSIGPPSVDWLGAPLSTQGKTIGVVVVQSYTEGIRFADEDRAILTFVSEQVAMAIERKQTQARLLEASSRLQASADRYRLLFEANPLPMWVFEHEGLRILAVNDAAIQSYGYSREEFLDLTIKDIRPPEDVPALLEALASRPEGMSRVGVWRHRKKDGTILQVEVSSHPIEFDGRSSQLVLAHDVTERRKAEAAVRESNEALLALFGASPIAIAAIDREGRVMSWNPAAERIFGWKASEVVGRPLPSIPPEFVEETQRITAGVLDGANVASYESRRHRKDGSPLDVSVSCAPLRDGQGKVRGLVVVFEDITLRKSMERRLVESERLATMGQLAGFIAHELNTPLTSISLLTSAVQRRVKDDVAQEKLEKINEERRRAAGITRQLLGISKERSITALETDLRAVVTGAVDQVRRSRKKGVSIDVEVGDTPIVLIIDPLQLREAITTLVQNAVDATTHGSVRVEVKKRPASHAVVVSDTGSGMSEEVMSHVFEPFFTTKGPGEKLGLGLLLAKHIVAGHGGTIEVASHVGQGSTFTLLLPRRGAT